MTDYLEFRISSGLKDIIGKDLITDDFIAVFELVKNSFDAQAKNVTITFEEDKIIISDNGKGMSLQDLKKKWLFVAYSAKKDGSEDEEKEDHKKTYRDKIQAKRHYAGAKGIGRFSCDRLGRFLTLRTQSKKTLLLEQIKLDWLEFEKDQEEDFQNIKVEHNTLDSENNHFPNNSLNGTSIEIAGLSSSWNREKLKQLKHSLEKLINPFSETNEFNIEIICKREIEKDNLKDKNGNYIYIERDRINGNVKNSILEILDIKTTQISVNINLDFIETKIFDRGTSIYHIREKNQGFSHLSNVRIDLYFLNRAAKMNFKLKMGVEVVNFGSVFLFKNGFRVQPFGDTGDDSWGLDYRSQQGYNRTLGTRDLFGRVEIITDDTKEFKEVSSRDGGLVETFGYYQLQSAFKEKALIRLERYVVGVLWGEGFKRKKYFGDGDEAFLKADSYRKDLQEKDKFSDSIEFATSNLGSKIDFIQIIKSLSANKDIEIIDFNRDFVDLVNDKLDEINSKYISDLEIIAAKTNDPELKNRVLAAEEKYQQLIRDKEEAEGRAIEEEKKRKEAELKAKKEEEARKLAERKQKEAEEKKRQAELIALRKEKERAEAELEKIKAEQKAKEEKEKREKAEKETTLHKQQVARYKAAESVDYIDLRDSNHIIGVYSDIISKKILLLKRRVDNGKELSRNDLLNFIQGISLANEKISTITRFTTKSNYLKATLETTEDIVSYIVDYIQKIYQVLYSIDILIATRNISFIKKFQPIELITAIDNILSNSRKKSASKVIFNFSLKEGDLQLSIKDIGEPLSESITDWKLIFEEGITTTKGSGLGLSHVKRIVEENLKGQITYNPNYTDGFELIITIPK